jgi:hypothetical protein
MVLVLYRIHAGQISLTRVERQALIALAVRASAQIRRRTGVDPLDGNEIIDAGVLRRLGITDDEIDRQLVAAYLNCLSTMPKIGLGKAALEALREVVTHRSLVRSLESMRENAAV